MPIMLLYQPIPTYMLGERDGGDMTGKLEKFDVECGIHGAAIVARSSRLTTNCLSDGEIDWHVNALKADIDACGREMKRRAKKERDAAFFGKPARA